MMDDTEVPDDERGTGRMEAFSNGVMAVAITLLVLNLTGRPKHVSPRQ